MAIQLQTNDFQKLVAILQKQYEFLTEERRVDFVLELFAGSPRKDDILGLLNLGGQPRAAAVRLITRLTQFGQHEPGQETLGILINQLISYMGDGEDKAFLEGLFARYPLQTTPVASRGIDEWRGRLSVADVQEKVIGENTLRDIVMLELALEAAKGVIRIRTADSLGSGFLVGPRLIMTNNHVLARPEEAQQSRFEFNYQLDPLFRPRPVFTTRALPDGLFYTNPTLDVTVVEIEEVPAGTQPLKLARERASRDQRVNIIQHPGGHYKKISMQNNFVAYADNRLIQYLTTTQSGSSGSPVLNNQFVVIGVHHSGGLMPEPGNTQRYLRNAGSSMLAVLDDLAANAPDIYPRLSLY